MTTDGLLKTSILLGLLTAVASGDESTALVPESATYFQDQVRPVLATYCSACHEDNDSEGAVLFLTAQTAQDVAANRRHWKSVAEQLRNRTMPPTDEAQPHEADRLRIAAWIDRTLQQTACQQGPYAGHVTTRRLNRNEYDFTIRDLLGLELDLAQKFPVDGSGGEGFDNNGETLFLPPLLLERYLEAATEAIAEVVIIPPLNTIRTPVDFYRDQQPLNSDSVIAPESAATTILRIYTTAEYQVQLTAAVPESETTVQLQIDDIPAEQFSLSAADRSTRVADQPTAASGDESVQQSVRIRLARGLHGLTLKCTGGDGLQLQQLSIQEIRPDATAEQRAKHKQLVGRHSGETRGDDRQLAAAAIRRLADRAFRRPVRDAEVESFLILFDRATEREDPFEEALQQALRAILISPHFVFRIEQPADSTMPQPVSDYELASRLSYFLWSSMPDERLFDLAKTGQLADDQVLTTEVRRLLTDDKAAAFYYEFTGQWLGTIEVAASVIPDTGKFKGEFNTELLMDLRDEPVRLFEHLVREDRSLLELIDPGYAIFSERLAQHYQLNGEPRPEKTDRNPWSQNPERSAASEFQLIELSDPRRGGVLGMGGVHLLTSYPTRTSPVLRGGWVLETFLGVRVPAPPPDVPELKTSRNQQKLSVREALAEHRDATACAACHRLMDPPGFALENYDVLGRWRDQDAGLKIDASATLPSGESFQGLPGLRQVLLDRRDEFIRHLTGRMLGYALGRSLSDRDDCTINRIAQQVAADDYRAQTLIREIVLSTPFRMHQREAE